ncbi:MAG TPA: hypothetical protein VE569_02030, partial [Acidimicrobiia bacterium]|nr:hypothetical protein [Acidimicrobiia bacterium]
PPLTPRTRPPRARYLSVRIIQFWARNAAFRKFSVTSHRRAVGGHSLGAVLRRLGQALARFVGLVMTILGVWVFAINRSKIHTPVEH